MTCKRLLAKLSRCALILIFGFTLSGIMVLSDASADDSLADDSLGEGQGRREARRLCLPERQHVLFRIPYEGNPYAARGSRVFENRRECIRFFTEHPTYRIYWVRPCCPPPAQWPPS